MTRDPTPALQQRHLRPPARGVGSTERRLAATLRTTQGFLMWLGINAGLALVMKWIPMVATLHAGLVVVAVFVIGVGGKPSSILMLSAYIAGSEILWRMSGASVPWLLGEYALILLFGLALLRWRRHPPLIALLYIVPLLISIPLTFGAFSELDEARQAMAFNLAGPVALFMALWFAAAALRRPPEPRAAVSVFLGPVFAVAVLALGSLLSAGTVEFTDASNFVASGGFGPNQVASVLSLGLLLVLMQRFLVRWRGVRGIVLAVLAIFLAFQAALTFSRSGLAMTVGAFAVTLALAFRKRRQRLSVLASGLAMASLFAFLLVPGLEKVTQGGFSTRYTNPSLTGRETIAKSDLEIWRENPVLGVGPGVATQRRAALLGQRIAGHTEFTRMLAEHGVWGLMSLLALTGILIQLVRKSGRQPLGPVSAGLAAWVVLYMTVNAFRLVIPAFAIGLAVLLMASTPGVPHPVGRSTSERIP